MPSRPGQRCRFGECAGQAVLRVLRERAACSEDHMSLPAQEESAEGLVQGN